MMMGKEPAVPVSPPSAWGAEGVDRDSFDLRQLVRAFLRRRWRILGLTVLAAAVVYALVGMAAPTYTAEAKVILDPQKAQVSTSSDIVANIDPNEQVLNGEVAVLTSNLLLQRVRAALPDDVIAALDPAQQPASVVQRFKTWVQDHAVMLFNLDPSQFAEPEVAPDAELRETLLLREIRDSLRVYNEPDSYVVTIRADTAAPDVARILANTVADTYIGAQLDARQESIELATRWLEDRLDVLRLEVEQAEAAVAGFQAASLVQNGGTLDNASQQLSELNNALIQARGVTLATRAKLNELTAITDAQGLLAGAPLVDSITMESLRATALDLRGRDAVLARSFDADNQRRVDLRESLNEVESGMETEVRNALVSLASAAEIAKASERSLRQNIADLEQKVVAMSQSGLGLRQLEREASAARIAFEALLTRLTEARTQQQMQQPDAKLIAQAVTPDIPTTPRPKLMAAFAAAVAMTLATAFTFFNELTPTAFRSSRELQSATGLPVLTALPVLRGRQARNILRYLKKSPYDLYAERTRQLRTLLGLSLERSQSVIVLSSIPGEGKTSTAIALAHLIAKSGLSTVMVECDLRRPSLYRALGLKQKADFAGFIRNECTLLDAIEDNPALDFDVMAIGRPFQQGADELTMNWLGPVMTELKRVYDVVIVDSPPVLVVSDALLVAQAVDRRLYVVGFDTTPRAAVRDGLTLFREAGIGISGLVLSKVDLQRSSEENAESYGY